MSKKEEKHLNAKQKAYDEKQSKKANTIVMTIICCLIILAIAYMGWAMFMMGI